MVNIIRKVRVDWKFANFGNSPTNSDLVCIFDTGSPINLIRASAIPTTLLTTTELQRTSYYGLGKKPLHCYGSIVIDITIKTITKSVSCLILPDHLLPTDLLLGRNCLTTFGIALSLVRDRDSHWLTSFWDNLCLHFKVTKKTLFAFCEDFIHKYKTNEQNKKEIAVPIKIDFDLTRVPTHLARISHNRTHIAASLNRISKICPRPFIEACRKHKDSVNIAQSVKLIQEKYKKKKKLYNDHESAFENSPRVTQIANATKCEHNDSVRPNVSTRVIDMHAELPLSPSTMTRPDEFELAVVIPKVNGEENLLPDKQTLPTHEYATFERDLFNMCC